MPNVNTAYDFERFERVSSSHTAPSVAQPPELRVVKSRQKPDNSFWVYMALIFTCVLAVLAALLYNKMVLTELTSKMEAMQSQYSQLQNEYKRMEVDLESKVSLRTVEDIATTKLGMAKMEDYQIEYIDLGSESCVLMSRASSPTAVDYVKQAWCKIWEYFTK